ncbi:ABC transporter ATP-binding protein [Patulibacter sp.]|uniref:ABC transporter ATP-binding protein n=1 Tax=Patulibacter sp. TaxID=1912859 RepID=UPI00271D523A|nr:ATP-binding cassette domain-containing protein [Patulibacter sp.]MDO9408762.1 ATP-binding cassette domain-containing protein [Patulibacter sp.]
MLRLDGIARRFGDRQAVVDASFAVSEGSVFGLLGPNGAGKTTTIRMVLGMLGPDAGSITWHGRPVSGEPRSTFGYMPEERGVYPRMPADEHVALFGELYGLDRTTARARASTWLERLELPGDHDARVDTLSKGNQQKVQFASAVAHDPKVLVLDEPFSGLDPVNQVLFERTMLELAEAGTTVLLSTHDLDRVELFCREVAMIASGTVRFAGGVDELRARHDDLRRLVVEVVAEPDDPRLGFADAPAPVREEPPAAGVQRLVWELPPGVDPDALVAGVVGTGLGLRRLEIVEAPLREIFLREATAS